MGLVVLYSSTNLRIISSSCAGVPYSAFLSHSDFSVLNHLSMRTLSLYLALPSMLCATWRDSGSVTYSSEPNTLPWPLFMTEGVP